MYWANVKNGAFLTNNFFEYALKDNQIKLSIKPQKYYFIVQVTHIFLHFNDSSKRRKKRGKFEDKL